MIFAFISILIGISFGSVDIPIAQLGHAFLTCKSHSSLMCTIIFHLRLPRTLCAFTTGGLLALSGSLMQTLLKNPLADPYVLGISGGGAVASLIAILLGLGFGYLSFYSFVGCFLSMALVIAFVHQSRANSSSLRLLLTGVVVATGWSALISFILTISPDHNLRGMLFWLMGDLSYAHFSFWELGILLMGLLASLALAKQLNILSRGNWVAQSLGVNTKHLEFILYVISSLLTSVAVSLAGCIGFVGLIVPHMLRLLGSSDHRFVIPGSVLLGGALLTIADTVARSVIAPVQLPVGIVTALIGVPAFLILLKKG
ncbi:MAG: iron ABC transporter permease [Gammaproteobacteria bacterium]|nr:iron ABC transporter permease [Gammaproteobacteria bacterium]